MDQIIGIIVDYCSEMYNLVMCDLVVVTLLV